MRRNPILIGLLIVIVSGLLAGGTTFANSCSMAKQTSYDQQILADTPTAYYPLSEWEVCDHSRRGLNAGWYSPLKTTMIGSNGGYTFDGTADMISIPSRRWLSVTHDGAMTIEVWIRPDRITFASPKGYTYILGKGTNGQHEYALRFYSHDSDRPNRISGYAFNPDGGLGIGSYFQDDLLPNEWMHIVFVINAREGYTKIYRDGIMRDSDPLKTEKLTVTPEPGIAPLNVATRDLDTFFPGAIAKLAIYDYELTPDQISRHYATMELYP